MTTLAEAIANGHGAERSFNCHVHQDANASASVNVDKGLWYCYTCGARGKVGDVLDENIDWTSYHSKVERLLRPPPEPYPESWLDLFDSGPVHPYWLNRFSETTCRHFRLGYDPSEQKPCYPLRYPNGEVAGLVHRSVDGSRPKYKYPWGVDVKKLLFNYEPYAFRDIYLVEGATDAMALWEVGREIAVFAVMGSSLGTVQLDLISKCDPVNVVLAFDQDEAGNKAAAEASGMLRRRGIRTVRAAWDRDLGKDPGELTLEDRRNMLVTALVR
jgi:DNA primase